MPDAIRMAFSYLEGGRISLIHSYRADLAIPLNESLPEAPGYHVVARDTQGNELFRVGARGLFPDFHESFSKDGTIQQTMPPTDGTFVVVLPYQEDIDHVTITKVYADTPMVDADLSRAMLAPRTRETEIATFPVLCH